jgi:hypothetical protein
VFADNADVLWQYDRDSDDTRYLHAYGRGINDLRGVVELDEGVTKFKAISRCAPGQSAAMREAVEFVTANPECKRADAYNELSIGQDHNKGVVDEALRLGVLVETHPDGRTASSIRTG